MTDIVKDRVKQQERKMKKVRNYNNIGPVTDCMKEIESQSLANFLTGEKFFSGACYTCGVLGKKGVNLKRCSGCQLISYCSIKCQKFDWVLHKKLCKKFPVINGKNVIVRKNESGKDQMKHQIQTSAIELHISMLSELELSSPFLNPRVCNICYEARPEKLFDCRCCAVAYCSKEHQMENENHWTNECAEFYICAMSNWFLTKHHRLKIPEGLLNEANLTDGLSFATVSKLSKYSSEEWLETIINLVNERLSIPLLIYHSLRKLKLTEERKNIFEITSLTIHIVDAMPMLDPRMWEFFLHQLPNLKQLNLTFLCGGMNIYNRFNTLLSVERCSECSMKQRVITYNIHPMHYHEYFSSNDYVQPDVVVAVGVEQIFNYTKWDNEKAHNFTSQLNMAYNNTTPVILTANYEDELEKCLKSFREAKPIKVLLPVRMNPLCGYSTWRSPWPSEIYNKVYVTCCIQGIN